MIKKPKNLNYCGTVVEIDNISDIAGAERIKSTTIFGNPVIVSSNTRIGDSGVYFPTECALSDSFLQKNNLYEAMEKNIDQTKKGFFGDSGRVRALRLRGSVSNGIFLPLSSFFDFIDNVSDLEVGVEFDELDGVEICRKYVPRGACGTPKATSGKNDKCQSKQFIINDQLISHQFSFHYDTSKLEKNLDKINPDTVIAVTDKLHGTSAIFANVLVNRNLKWYEKILRKLGIDVKAQEYGFICASRRKVRSITAGTFVYGDDLWSRVGRISVKPILPKGFILYGEITGYDGKKEIQEGYTYPKNEPEAALCYYTNLWIYRIVYMNPDGHKQELSWPQLKSFCSERGLLHVPEIFYGRAGEYTIEVPNSQENIKSWRELLLTTLNDFVLGRKCRYNRGRPAEGVVVSFDGVCPAYKVKNFDFLVYETKQNDKGVVNIEDES